MCNSFSCLRISSAYSYGNNNSVSLPHVHAVFLKAGLIAVRNLDCTGAATLAACHFNILTAAACSHSQDAALECSE